MTCWLGTARPPQSPIMVNLLAFEGMVIEVSARAALYGSDPDRSAKPETRRGFLVFAGETGKRSHLKGQVLVPGSPAVAAIQVLLTPVGISASGRA